MTTIKAFIKKHPLLSYFALAFAISWGGVVFVAGGPGGISANSEASEMQVTFLYPVLIVGPSVAGILLTALLYGRAGLSEFRCRLLKWRVGARWYAVALLTAPLSVTAAFLALSLTSSEFVPSILTTSDKTSLLLIGIAAGLMVGIFEELGWTGFAIPRMKLRYGVLGTGLIVGLLWGAWHFPPFFWGSGAVSGTLPLALFLPVLLFTWLPAYRVLMVWVYDRTESLLMAMLMHTSLVASNVILVPLATGVALVTYDLVWAAVLWVVVGAVAVANGRHLSRGRRKIMKHNVVRSVLTILLAGVAVFDIVQGVLVLTGVRTPAVHYQGTLFTDATIPMLLVAIVVGGSSFLAAAMVFTRHAWSLFLAAAAGLIMISWELTQIMVVQQFSSIFVYIGLAVISLAEYLWTTEFSGQQLPAKKLEVIRIALLLIAAFIATSAIEGGVAVLGGVVFGYKLPLSWLSGTPFSDYTIPGLALAIVVGGSALIAAATVFIHREWAVLVSVVAGLMMDGYLVVEIVSIDSKLGNDLPTALAVQLFYFVLGLALIGLAGFLWMREYRTQHFHLGHATHG